MNPFLLPSVAMLVVLFAAMLFLIKLRRDFSDAASIGKNDTSMNHEVFIAIAKAQAQSKAQPGNPVPGHSSACIQV